MTPNRLFFDSGVEVGEVNGHRYTLQHDVRHQADDTESEEEVKSPTTIRFKRTITVSIDAPRAELLTIEQFDRLERIFDDAFNFRNFMANFMDNFPRMEEMLQNELDRFNLNDSESNGLSLEAIAQLPEVIITERH